MTGTEKMVKNKSRVKNRFIFFSVVLFLAILIAGSITFVLSMRQIVRTNKGIELSQLLEIEKIWLESTVNADIAMVLKMADSPLLRQFFRNPEHIFYSDIAMMEFNSFRGFFSEGYEIFWISDTDKIFHMDNNESYKLDPYDPENYWYHMTLYETELYNFNINYNPDLDAIKLWINAPVFDLDDTPIGILGTGINITEFTDRIYRTIKDRGEMYFFNTHGEITGATDIDLVRYKVHIHDVMDHLVVDVMEFIVDLNPGDKKVFSTSRGEVAVGTIPLLDWYSIVFMPDRISDFDNSMTAFFLVVFILILIIFIVFNIFIAGYLRSLRKTMDSLEVASNAKSTFLTNMSHEIRTPMNAIIGITDIMMQNDDLPDKMTEGLNKIYGSCDLLLGIINDILDFSKIEAGKLDVKHDLYFFASLINDSVHLNTMRIKEKPIEFELIVDENVPKKLLGDELRINQILNNLLSNAFKYTESGKITLSITSEPVSDDNITLIFNVTDTGHGMTEQQLEVLFDEYTRFNEGKRTVEGTGLGLAITHRLITLMSGEIHVESEPGKGTSVIVRLPQECIDSEVLGPEIADNLRSFYVNYLTRSKRSHIEYEPMPYGKVLIVDDVETNIYVAAGLFEMYDLQIETVMSGFEAVEKIKQNKIYDIIFMDHMMPDLDGMETTCILRDMGYSNPIIALTANAVAGQADVFLQNGFDDFISKPIDIRQMNAVLMKFIYDKQTPETIASARTSIKITPPPPDTDDNTGDNTVINKVLLESFIRDAVKTVETIDELKDRSGFPTEDDLRQLTITIHGIKGALGNLGEKNLSEKARYLEEACRTGNTESISTDLPGFYEDLKILTEKLKPDQTDKNGQNEKDVYDDPKNIISILAAIQNMCADYNRRGALDLISDTERCSEKTRSVLDNVQELVLQSEYDEAEIVVSDYIKSIL